MHTVQMYLGDDSHNAINQTWSVEPKVGFQFVYKDDPYVVSAVMWQIIEGNLVAGIIAQFNMDPNYTTSTPEEF